MNEKQNLLIVDDEEHVTRSLKRSLRDQYNVMTANSAREALDILDTQTVGVILTDQRMPDMTGVELLKIVRDKYPFTSGILLSGYSDSNALMDALNIGSVHGFIQKPWDMDVVRIRLQEAARIFETLMKETDGSNNSVVRYDRQQIEEMKTILEMVSSSALDALFQPSSGEPPNILKGTSLNHQFLDRMQDGFAAIQADGSFLFCNQVFSKMLSFQEKAKTEPVTMEDLKPYPEIIQAIKKGINGEHTHSTYKISSPAGKLAFLEIGATPVAGSGDPSQTLLILRDQTDREKTIAHLRAMNAVAAAISKSKPFSAGLNLVLQACIQGFNVDAVVAYFIESDRKSLRYAGSHGLLPATIEILSRQNRILCLTEIESFNRERGVESVFGFSREEFLISHELCESENMISAVMAPMFDSNELTGLIAIYTRSPHIFDEKDFDLLSSIGNQIAVARENEHLHEELKTQAHIDALTGLYNRRYFFELANRQYHRARKKQSPIAAFMIDADQFKPINDAYGHQVGDQALKKIADVLNASIRPGDLVCRFGGDEFALLIPDCDFELAEKITGRIQSQFDAAQLIVEDRSIKLSGSIGYAIADFEPDETLEGLLNQSDAQMYLNKREKKTPD